MTQMRQYQWSVSGFSTVRQLPKGVENISGNWISHEFQETFVYVGKWGGSRVLLEILRVGSGFMSLERGEL